MPMTGRPAAAASQIAVPSPDAWRLRDAWPKFPTPGTTTWSARRTWSGSVVSTAEWPPAPRARTTLFRLFTP
jgi:hypothetical protein